MATEVRPGHRFSTSDWFTSNYALSTNANRERDASHETRMESRFLRNETDNKAQWDQYDNNTRLADRVSHIRELKDVLDRTLVNVECEIGHLNEAKDNMEHILDHRVGLANHINVENLVSREGRYGIDVVQDIVQDQLLKEQELLECIKRQLQCKIDESFEHLCVLQDVCQQIVTDVQNKNITLEIDINQYNLTVDSNGVSFKPNPTRVPKGSLTVKQWEDFCLYNEKRADIEMCNSTRLRESILRILQQCASDLTAQNIATTYELRHRSHEYEVSLDEMQYQKKLTEEEIAETEVEIRRIEESIYIKMKMSKLAHSRLENRTYRPNEELCRDNVVYGITDEVKQLGATIRALQDKLRQSQHALHCLELNLHRINDDIQIKMNSLHIERQCIESRKKLLPLYPLSDTGNNQEAVGIKREQMNVLPY